ncbi:MAG: DUF4136 domain-containing protein [Terriglobales bacterium]
MALAVLCAGLVYAQKVKLDYDKKADFSRYQTYAWIEGTQARQTLWHLHIVGSIDQSLRARGLRQKRLVITLDGCANCRPEISIRRYTLSETNGDKARFARERKKKALKRTRNRELKKALGLSKQTSTNARLSPRAG